MNYQKLREQILIRDDNTCQICFVTDKPLDIHHIIPRRMSGRNDENNLTTVCVPCHRKIEFYKSRKKEGYVYMQRISLFFDDELLKKLDKIMKKLDRNASDTLRQLVKGYDV